MLLALVIDLFVVMFGSFLSQIVDMISLLLTLCTVLSGISVKNGLRLSFVGYICILLFYYENIDIYFYYSSICTTDLSSLLNSDLILGSSIKMLFNNNLWCMNTFTVSCAMF